eukprot:758910-Hanusia_phi.AAC.3
MLDRPGVLPRVLLPVCGGGNLHPLPERLLPGHRPVLVLHQGIRRAGLHRETCVVDRERADAAAACAPGPRSARRPRHVWGVLVYRCLVGLVGSRPLRLLLLGSGQLQLAVSAGEDWEESGRRVRADGFERTWATSTSPVTT